jgi:hypothetical protein
MVAPIKKSKLTYKKGDLFKNLPDSPVMIAHVCNNVDSWGAGFVLAINKYSMLPKQKYHEYMANMKKCNNSPTIGSTNFVRLDDGNMIANMIAQNSHIQRGEQHPLRYFALMECMRQVRANTNGKYNPHEIYCPKFGSDRARGHWPAIERMIIECWVDKGIDVTVFELGGKNDSVVS